MRYRRGAAGRRLFDPAALASGSGKEDLLRLETMWPLRAAPA
jgi:hypothetical protein